MRDSELDRPAPERDFRPISAPSGSPRDPRDPRDPLDLETALARFTATLQREVDALEAPDFDELSRAVDGELDLGEQALWEERLAGDAELARRAAELERFRAEVGRGAAVLPFARRPAKVSLSGWLAAAAVLLFVVTIREVPQLVSKYGSVRAAVPHLLDWRDEKVFADGFETGDASDWSAGSPSG